MAEDSRVSSISPSNCEYTITEGGKSLAKIIRLIFISFIDCLIRIISDFMYIFQKADSIDKMKVIAIFLAYFLMALAKLIHLNKVFQLVYETTQANSNKENTYVEAINNIAIIKSGCEENKIINKYSKIILIFSH